MGVGREMKDKLTILIPTSPIPSHPSTRVLDETIDKLWEYPELRDCKIIIMLDGIHESLEHRKSDYEGFKNNINRTSNIVTIDYGEHTHQAEMTKKAISDHVKTPLVMFVEHDTSPIGEIPFERICEMVIHSNDINYIRFHIFDRILEEHEHLMIGKEFQMDVPFVRTIQWSQRPHIAKTEWYKDILSRFFHGDKTMIEDVMHSIVQESYFKEQEDHFGLGIYAPDGNMLRSYHSDARGDDKKIIDTDNLA